jgi:hypothetical protein
MFSINVVTANVLCAQNSIVFVWKEKQKKNRAIWVGMCDLFGI